MAIIRPAFRTLYLLFFAPIEIALPLFRLTLVGIHPKGRQSPAWSLKQALLVRLIKSVIRTICIARRTEKLTLQPGSEGDRFAVVVPAASDLYVGPARDPELPPCAVGGTWTPKCPQRAKTADPKDLLVALHFHGGAFVIGDGRDGSSGFAASLLTRDAGCTHVFSVQYRLATDSNGRFPAPLQDAVSAYMYLLKTVGVPADRIVLSGDSAGGNIALALLRYIHDYGAKLDIPSPAVAILWSPWTDITIGDDETRLVSVVEQSACYLHERLLRWGTRTITGGGKIASTDPYLSPGRGHGFASKTPMWVHSGGVEVLYTDNVRFVETFKAAGAEVEWVVDPYSPHDMALLGKVLGFEKETRASAAKAGLFIRRHVA